MRIVLPLVVVAMLAMWGCDQAGSAPTTTTDADAAAADHEAEGHVHSPDEAEAPAEPTDDAGSRVTPAPEGAVASNKLCPVGGHDVAAEGKLVVFDGKVYGFCCDDCVEPFTKDPVTHVASIAP